MMGKILSFKKIKECYSEFSRFFCFCFEPRGYWIFIEDSKLVTGYGPTDVRFYLGNILRLVIFSGLSKLSKEEQSLRKRMFDKHFTTHEGIQICPNLIKYTS